MSFETTILTKLESIIQWMNSVVENSKKIIELPENEGDTDNSAFAIYNKNKNRTEQIDKIPISKIENLQDSLNSRLRFDFANQNLTTQQKANALINLGINLTHIKIQEALVEIEGKSDLTKFELNDKFSLHTDNRYVVGKIIDVSTPIILPTDLYNKTKIKLVVDNMY
jgi:hypothetical protein